MTIIFSALTLYSFIRSFLRFSPCTMSLSDTSLNTLFVNTAIFHCIHLQSQEWSIGSCCVTYIVYQSFFNNFPYMIYQGWLSIKWMISGFNLWIFLNNWICCRIFKESQMKEPKFGFVFTLIKLMLSLYRSQV